MPQAYWDRGHPYRFRTWFRSHLPWWLIKLGLVDKGEDCEAVGASHWWYKRDQRSSGCYHCRVTRSGQLWREGR